MPFRETLFLTLILFVNLSIFAQGETGFIEVEKDIRLFYQKVGKGKQTILVPLHLYLFEDFKHLAKDKTFIFYDVRNRGRSSPVADGEKISIQEDVEDVERIRRNFKLNKISLIGESYVGLMVVMYAMKYPQNVERLVQIGAVPLKFGTEYPKEFQPNDEKPVIDPEERKKVDELYKQGYHKTNPRDFCEKEWKFSQLQMVGNPANAPKIKSLCHLENEWAVNLERHFDFHFVGVQRLDIPKAEVANVTVPVLTIHGTKDRNAVYGAGREWANLLPNARLLTVKGAAHFPWVDEPKLVFSAIETFLSGKFPKEAEKLKKTGENRAQTAFTIPERDLIPEGIAFDSVSKSFFVSSTYKRKIVRVNSKGKSSDFTSEAQDGLTGVVGMRVDEKRRILWAISSDAGEGMPMKNQLADERGISKIFKYDLKTGKLIKKYVLDKRPQNNFLNDLTLHPNGDVFISNTRTSEIYTISLQKDELEIFLKLENAQFPNGIDFSPDGKFLFTAVTGNAAVINLETKQVSLISLPTTESFWADGLYFYQNSLVAVGWRENRHEVTQYFLNETRDKITGFRTLESAQHPAFLQPTTGVIVGNELYFIANSQLQFFKNLYAQNKDFDLQKLREVVVLKTKLN